MATDETVEPWLRRIMRPIWGMDPDGYSALLRGGPLDPDTAAELAKQVIQEACSAGQCVIVGRGAQCILNGRKDVFNVFVYAAWADRVKRIRERVKPDANIEEFIRSQDRGRYEYVQATTAAAASIRISTTS